MPQNPRTSLHSLDQYLESFLDFDDGYFIETEAFDGIFASNTHYFEKVRNWKGLLIDPVSANDQKCKINRSKSQRIHAALVGPNYSEPSITIDAAGLMSTIVDDANNIKNRAEYSSHGRSIQGITKGYQEKIPAYTLSEIIDSYAGKSTLDLISIIDVGGYEEEVKTVTPPTTNEHMDVIYQRNDLIL